jgi:serine/threonine protein kinase/Tol biopolymer transport system component
MKMDAGKKLGPYEIVARIGIGGMGEVYRAKDPRVGRDVAIKVSTEQFTKRFEGEARAVAALNHPNICTLYDVGPNYLVMELIDGPTLAERIHQGPMPLEEALAIARQIADALEAAHEGGVVHRDLKPGNIKIKPGGLVKVLDFGLAKVGKAMAVSEDSPTISAEVTQTGVILGTAAYMSPEQAKGKPVDKRADNWAFGVLLYEMLTGERLFRGETLSETLAAVLKDTPDLNRVPAEVRPLLRSCLRKDPKQRLKDIADARLLLEEGEANAASTAPSSHAPRHTLAWPIIALLFFLTTLVLVVSLLRQTSPPVPQEVRMQIPVPEGLTFNPGTQAAISPDGRWLAFAAVGSDKFSRYYLRAVGSLEVKPLPGSEGISVTAPPPFWSYDSRFVVYGDSGRLMKSDIALTPAQTIAEIGEDLVQGGTWNRDDVIVYAKNRGSLMRVSAFGGKPIPVTLLSPGEIAHRWPQFLPDGHRFLYLRAFGSPKRTGIYIGSIDVKAEEQDMQLLLPTDRQAWWASSETGQETFLITQREKTLLAQPFDLATAQLSGTPTTVLDGVGSYSTATAGLWSVARTSALTYRSGGEGWPQLTWRDLNGATGVVGAPANYPGSNGQSMVSVTQDGKRAAFVKTDEQGNTDIWVRDIASGRETSITFDPRREDSPVWSHDGSKIIFAADRGGNMDLYEKNADGTGEEALLLKSGQDKVPTSWSSDGKFVLFNSWDPKTSSDLWVLPLATLKPRIFLKTEATEVYGQFSPDNHWIAYFVSSPGYRVYVRPFSSESASPSEPSDPHWMISMNGAAYPRWSSDGKFLYYFSLEGNTLMSVDVLKSSSGATFQWNNSPRLLFGDVPFRGWDVDQNNRFFYLPLPPTIGPPPPITVVLNWMEYLKK